MRNPFIPIILLILAGASYFAFIAPFWNDIGTIKSEQKSAQETIKQGEELKTLVADISEKVKQFEERDPNGRLGAILPLEIDEILFLNDLSALVGNQGLEAKELTLSGDDDTATTENEGAPNVDTQARDGVSNDRTHRTVSFTVSATYPQFVALLREIEQNLVLLEIESVDFTAGTVPETSTGGSSRTTSARSGSVPVADYSITLRTISVR